MASPSFNLIPCSHLSLILSPTSFYLNAHVGVASFPRFFYHAPSICPPSPAALIMPRFAPLTRAPFLRPLSVSLASVQRVKMEDEIDSKDSHVIWRGTKEDPGGLGRLSTTSLIPCTTVTPPPFHTPTENNTLDPLCTLKPPFAHRVFGNLQLPMMSIWPILWHQ